MNKKTGFLVAFEGIDGSGKSTLCKNVFYALQQSNDQVILTKEPGATQCGQKIRAIVHENKLSPITEFLLFSADRAEHIKQVVVPAFEQGAIVLSDRMADSSRAYQGYGRGIDITFIDNVTREVMSGIEPDLIIYCKIDAATAFKRIISRNEALTVFEQEKTAFFERVITGFETIFAHKNNVYVVDAILSPELLSAQVVAEIQRRLPSSLIQPQPEELRHA